MKDRGVSIQPAVFGAVSYAFQYFWTEDGLEPGVDGVVPPYHSVSHWHLIDGEICSGYGIVIGSKELFDAPAPGKAKGSGRSYKYYESPFKDLQWGHLYQYEIRVYLGSEEDIDLIDFKAGYEKSVLLLGYRIDLCEAPRK